MALQRQWGRGLWRNVEPWALSPDDPSWWVWAGVSEWGLRVGYGCCRVDGVMLGAGEGPAGWSGLVLGADLGGRLAGDSGGFRILPGPGEGTRGFL